MITAMFLDEPCFTMVVTGMVLELHHLASESICFCGAGGTDFFYSSIFVLISV
jgi:hypothetical protein